MAHHLTILILTLSISSCDATIVNPNYVSNPTLVPLDWHFSAANVSSLLTLTNSTTINDVTTTTNTTVLAVTPWDCGTFQCDAAYYSGMFDSVIDGDFKVWFGACIGAYNITNRQSGFFGLLLQAYDGPYPATTLYVDIGTYDLKPYWFPFIKSSAVQTYDNFTGNGGGQDPYSTFKHFLFLIRASATGTQPGQDGILFVHQPFVIKQTTAPVASDFNCPSVLPTYVASLQTSSGPSSSSSTGVSPLSSSSPSITGSSSSSTGADSIFSSSSMSFSSSSNSNTSIAPTTVSPSTTAPTSPSTPLTSYIFNGTSSFFISNAINCKGPGTANAVMASVWFKLSTSSPVPSSQTLFSVQMSKSSDQSIITGFSASLLRPTGTTGTSYNLRVIIGGLNPSTDYGASITANAWHHLVIMYDASSFQVSGWLDTTRLSPKSFVGEIGTATSAYIGSLPDGGDPLLGQIYRIVFTGGYNEIKTVALDSNYGTTLYNNGEPTPIDSYPVDAASLAHAAYVFSNETKFSTIADGKIRFYDLFNITDRTRDAVSVVNVTNYLFVIDSPAFPATTSPPTTVSPTTVPPTTAAPTLSSSSSTGSGVSGGNNGTSSSSSSSSSSTGVAGSGGNNVNSAFRIAALAHSTHIFATLVIIGTVVLEI